MCPHPRSARVGPSRDGNTAQDRHSTLRSRSALSAPPSPRRRESLHQRSGGAAARADHQPHDQTATPGATMIAAVRPPSSTADLHLLAKPSPTASSPRRKQSVLATAAPRPRHRQNRRPAPTVAARHRCDLAGISDVLAAKILIGDSAASPAPTACQLRSSTHRRAAAVVRHRLWATADPPRRHTSRPWVHYYQRLRAPATADEALRKRQLNRRYRTLRRRRDRRRYLTRRYRVTSVGPVGARPAERSGPTDQPEDTPVGAWVRPAPAGRDIMSVGASILPLEARSLWCQARISSDQAMMVSTMSWYSGSSPVS